jgi:xylose dehydrogenase (NAD/NADP)
VTTSLRWGLLGTAHINRRVIPAMRAARRSTLVAVASRDAARAAAYAREWDIQTAHATYDALLRDRQVDAIYIPLPNALHVEWTLRALDAGKHVLCEKPLALVPEDVDRIAAVARARSLTVAEAFMYRHEPLIARVLELLREGVVGPLWMLSTGFTYQQVRSPDVRLDASLGGGCLWDVGCYAVSIARLIAGAEPVTVMGTAIANGLREYGGRDFSRAAEIGRPDDLSHPEIVDEAFSGLLRFRSSLVASIHCSFRAHYRTWLDVFGTDGVLRVANPFRPGPLEAIEVQRGDEITHYPVEGSDHLFVRQIDDFVAAALDGKPPTVSLAESRGNTAALVALYASAREGRAVAI